MCVINQKRVKYGSHTLIRNLTAPTICFKGVANFEAFDAQAYEWLQVQSVF